MDAHVKDVVREMTKASDEERISFPGVVKNLMAAGVERYHADFITTTRTFYLPDGSFELVHGHKPSVPAQKFSAEGVEKALRAIQGREIQYLEFCARIAAAGCVGYLVSLAGRRAPYYGRTNDTRVERFSGGEAVTGVHRTGTSDREGLTPPPHEPCGHRARSMPWPHLAR